ncbi:unnamed protein product [Pleuronectes platessa]|uniref:Uncharacterized protein n=1 Tax=Pleuronectes platessa TaxID=8262 RepID=A0A9N7VRQ9_PLEPL|nr:unnamed protein product [Pleuronectes platessa]
MPWRTVAHFQQQREDPLPRRPTTPPSLDAPGAALNTTTEHFKVLLNYRDTPGSACVEANLSRDEPQSESELLLPEKKPIRNAGHAKPLFNDDASPRCPPAMRNGDEWMDVRPFSSSASSASSSSSSSSASSSSGSLGFHQRVVDAVVDAVVVAAVVRAWGEKLA